MLTDERYKQLMVDVGMPNSRSILQALQQCTREAIALHVYNSSTTNENNEVAINNYKIETTNGHKTEESALHNAGGV